ncbi:hypothetical protein [Kitasatospora sp. NBC_01302]|uniref:hypothetical protein n=1 Tax=Kitasatospora sp. NBC_01302 TaxID=2903575 RepID=UPI002E0FB334|nr:hypothetical protein OG294_40265 [Kitasatospora sp. NBC_01302]
MSDVLANPRDGLAAAPLSPAARQLLSRALTMVAQAAELDTEAQAAMAELEALAATGRASAPPPELEPIAYVKHISEAELRLADHQERRRAAEWPWDVWCRICLHRVGSHRTEEFAGEGADQHVAVFHVTQAQVHALAAAVAVGRMPAPEPVVTTIRERWKTRWDRAEQRWRPVRPTRYAADPAGTDAGAGL